jgi:cytochrome P450
LNQGHFRFSPDSDGKLLPKDSSVVIAPNVMGRWDGIWKNPNKFDPDRFEKENLQGMHAFSNVVFSAGSRNCIGK